MATGGDLEHICSVHINDVYMFMGRELEALDAIPAGNIVGMCRILHYIECRVCVLALPSRASYLTLQLTKQYLSNIFIVLCCVVLYCIVLFSVVTFIQTSC